MVAMTQFKTLDFSMCWSEIVRRKSNSHLANIYFYLKCYIFKGATLKKVLNNFVEIFCWEFGGQTIN